MSSTSRFSRWAANLLLALLAGLIGHAASAQTSALNLIGQAGNNQLVLNPHVPGKVAPEVRDWASFLQLTSAVVHGSAGGLAFQLG
jgi:hypothetical protein